MTETVKREPTNISGRVQLHVTITDPQAVYDQAAQQLVDDGVIGSLDDIEDEGPSGPQSMLGTRDKPDLAGCLRIIFDKGSSPGLEVEDSESEVDYDEDDEAA